jgi:hypothetical protein
MLDLAAKQLPMLDVDMHLFKCNKPECGVMRALYENLTGIGMIDNKLWR